ncbi:Protein of unknown function [Halogeometricum rufum]|jgi:uncharacterized membrane protein YtjA (UPF0391 family)|uniref:UPF0391 membrane protein SAMN04487947_1831 n=1 Tax=Halogeometricum rufum TaxID=553469 RepID=A0A1I6GYH0_9EURY|nr:MULTISPECIES: DUF1328 family protein [Halogeometricum]SFR47272.1 Protein of unknown function [Halogeometricum rufum]
MPALTALAAGVAVASSAVAVPLQSGGLLTLAIAFIVLAILAGLAGFRGVAGLSMSAARLLVVVFLVLAVLTFFL